MKRLGLTLVVVLSVFVGGLIMYDFDMNAMIAGVFGSSSSGAVIEEEWDELDEFLAGEKNASGMTLSGMTFSGTLPTVSGSALPINGSGKNENTLPGTGQSGMLIEAFSKTGEVVSNIVVPPSGTLGGSFSGGLLSSGSTSSGGGISGSDLRIEDLFTTVFAPQSGINNLSEGIELQSGVLSLGYSQTGKRDDGFDIDIILDPLSGSSLDTNRSGSLSSSGSSLPQSSSLGNATLPIQGPFAPVSGEVVLVGSGSKSGIVSSGLSDQELLDYYRQRKKTNQ